MKSYEKKIGINISPQKFYQTCNLQPSQQHQRVIYNLVNNILPDLIKHAFCSHHNNTYKYFTILWRIFRKIWSNMHFAVTATTPTSNLQSCEKYSARFDQTCILQQLQQHQRVIYNLANNIPQDLIKHVFCSHHNNNNNE